jgi:DNA-binding transcriptional regulator LsrR (DeoR family)
VILASGGDDKITVLRAALLRKTVSVFVTDEATAQKLLNSDGIAKIVD